MRRAAWAHVMKCGFIHRSTQISLLALFPTRPLWRCWGATISMAAKLNTSNWACTGGWINVFNKQVSFYKRFWSRAAHILNIMNTGRTEQKLVHETCIYSTAWLNKMRLFSRHNFAACLIIYCCFSAKHYLVLIKFVILFAPNKF